MNLDCNKPEDYRCGTCKRTVDPTDARWRMGRDGWEHNCPEQYPVVGHSPSERVDSEVIVEPVFNYETHAS